MKLFEPIKQRGEMSYNQPTWYIPVSFDEVKERFNKPENDVIKKFLLSITKQEITYKNFRTGSIRSNIYEHKHYCNLAYKKDKEYKRIFHYLEDDKLDESLEIYAEIHPHCYRHVAEMANYFGDRLPQEFYDTYQDIIYEVKENGNV
jgi:hypothetical protein